MGGNQQQTGYVGGGPEGSVGECNSSGYYKLTVTAVVTGIGEQSSSSKMRQSVETKCVVP